MCSPAVRHRPGGRPRGRKTQDVICRSSSNPPPLAPSRPHSRKTCEHEGGGGTPLQVPLARPLTERGVHLAGAKTARPTGGCLPKTQVKPGYTRESPGLPEKYLDARPHAAARPIPRAPAPTAARTACSSTRTAPCVLATSAKTQKAASAPGTACRRRCGRRGRATFCYKIEAVLRMRLCDPDQLIGKKRRNKLTAADTLFATSRAGSLERMNTTLGFHRHTLGGARRAVRELRNGRTFEWW